MPPVDVYKEPSDAYVPPVDVYNEPSDAYVPPVDVYREPSDAPVDVYKEPSSAYQPSFDEYKNDGTAAQNLYKAPLPPDTKTFGSLVISIDRKDIISSDDNEYYRIWFFEKDDKYLFKARNSCCV